MSKLTFVSLQADGSHVVLRDDAGTTYQLPITPELRQALRRPLPQISTEERRLRPRDIQSMLRAGASVAEIAERSDMNEDYIRRYEGPIIAERRWAIQQARECTVGRELDSPTLGDLVLDRLADRGVDTEDLTWDAFREEDEPWNIPVEYVAGDKRRRARWRLDMTTKSVRAMEDEARWLSETDSHSPRARQVDDNPTESILERLARHRGRRAIALDDDLDIDGDTIPPAHPPRPEEANDAVVLPFPPNMSPDDETPASGDEARSDSEPELDAPSEDELDFEVEKPREKPQRKRANSRRSNRRSVPSWDEIVFGTPPED
ncbi:MAG: septation protein SepH [Bowdeniella nasicola]|nr:septation protein SepH [Bowdeniella nasicola]